MWRTILPRHTRLLAHTIRKPSLGRSVGGIVVGNVRNQALSPTLLRIEPKGPVGFENRSTFMVVGREILPACHQKLKDGPDGTVLATGEKNCRQYATMHLARILIYALCLCLSVSLSLSLCLSLSASLCLSLSVGAPSYLACHRGQITRCW